MSIYPSLRALRSLCACICQTFLIVPFDFKENIFSVLYRAKMGKKEGKEVKGGALKKQAADAIRKQENPPRGILWTATVVVLGKFLLNFI